MLNKSRSKNRIFTKVISLILAGVFLSANTVYPESLRPPLLFSNNEKTDQNKFQNEIPEQDTHRPGSNAFLASWAYVENLNKNDPESRKYSQVLLQVGLEHKLRQEAEETDEFKLASIDAVRILELCSAENINIAEFIKFLKSNQIITEKFEKIIRLTVQSEENKAKLIKLYEANPDSFLFPEQGPYKIIQYIEKTLTVI